MKIVIDGRMLGWTGVGRYTHELLKNLEAIDRTNQYLVLIQDGDKTRWQPTATNFTAVTANIAPYSLGEQLKLPELLKSLAPDLVHFPAPNAPALFNGPKITTVHDLTLVDYQNVRGSWLIYQIKYWAFRLVIWRAIKSAAVVITDTKFVKSQITKRYHRGEQDVAAIALGPIIPIPAASNMDPIIIGPYLLYIGNAYPYKNLQLLVDAYRVAKQKTPDLKLVLVGPKDLFYDRLEAEVQNQNQGQKQEESIVFMGRASDDQLASLYQHASLYVFPSLSEGFGLPGLEAMSYGLPVLAANASCLPEVYGGAAVYFDPVDAKDLASKITDLLAHPKKLEEMRTAGLEKVKEYSWRKMAEETLAVYNAQK